MILVISTQADWGAMLCMLMRSRGYSCAWRSGALAGLERIRTHPAGEPLLVLLDHDLGDASGFEVLRKVRGEPSIATAAFVLCGSALDNDSRQEAMELEVVDFLVPAEEADFTANDLVSRIIRWYSQAMAETAIRAGAMRAA